MNWAQYYGPTTYYGTLLLRDFVADMKALNSSKIVTSAPVFKKDPNGSMPGLTPAELQSVMTDFLNTTQQDRIMPQDGIGAGAGAPPLSEIGSYFSAAQAAAAATGKVLWSTLEVFTANGGDSAQYPPADIDRVTQQITAEQPYVAGFVMYTFGNHMSKMATYYPVEAYTLYRRYLEVFHPDIASYTVNPVASYSFSREPSSGWPDNPAAPKLTDGTGGGYSQNSSWVGFDTPGSEQVIVTLDLGEKKFFDRVQALTRSEIVLGILHPQDVLIETSSNGQSWQTFGSLTGYPADTSSFSVWWAEKGSSANARYVRMTFTHQQWLMLAEIQILTNTCPPPRARC